MVTERERHGAREVLDRADLFEDLLEARLIGEVLVAFPLLRIHPVPPALVSEQPVERVSLQCKEAGDLQWFLDTGERDTMWTRSGS